MKKTVISTLLLAAFATSAFAADEGFYAGAALGTSSVNNIFLNTTMTKTSDTVYGILGGYQFNKNLAVEAEYASLGKFTATGGGATFNGKASVLSLDAVGILPLSNEFNLYGKLGVASVSTTLTTVPASANTGATRSTVTYGIGAQYNVSPAVGIRLGVDSYGAAVTGVGKSNFTINTYSLGAVFKF